MSDIQVSSVVNDTLPTKWLEKCHQDSREEHCIFPRRYRGFVIRDSIDQYQVDTLLDEYDESYDDFLDNEIERRGMSQQREQHLDQIEELTSQCDQLYQQTEQWTAVERISITWTQIVLGTYVDQYTDDLIVWAFKLYSTFRQLMLKVIGQINIEQADPCELFLVYRKLMHLVAKYHKVIQYSLFGFNPVKQMLANKLIEFMDHGAFESWLVFAIVFPEYVTDGLYPTFNYDGPYFNPILVQQLIKNNVEYHQVFVKHYDLITSTILKGVDFHFSV